MKAFYSLLLIVFFLIQVNAQPIGYIAPRAIIKDTVDSTISALPIATDSSSLAKPDSISLITEEEVPSIVKPKTITGVASFYSKNLEVLKQLREKFSGILSIRLQAIIYR